MKNSITICIIVFAIILVILLGYGIFKYIKSLKSVQHINDKTVVLLKTHTWTDHLEKFAIKLKNETVIHGIDFFILMHTNDGQLVNKIKNKQLKQHLLTFNETDIKKIYHQGFYSMWLSNHWILMWFYKQYRHKYQYFWTIEYDVRISGDSSKIWKYNGTEDFIYPIEPFQDSKWAWKNYYTGNKLKDNQKYYGYLQLARYSNNFLAYLDQCYQSGENGQDELITFSLFKRGNFTGTKNLLGKLIKSSWSVDNSESDKNKKLIEDSEKKYQSNKNHIRIFHPVK